MFGKNTMPKKLIILKDDMYFQKFNQNLKKKNINKKKILKDNILIKYISR
jgi:hypothetical protein